MKNESLCPYFIAEIFCPLGHEIFQYYGMKIILIFIQFFLRFEVSTEFFSCKTQH
jgi:hypothetical protein